MIGMCLINGIVARASRCAGNTNRCADSCHDYDFCPPAPMVKVTMEQLMIEMFKTKTYVYNC